MINKLNFISAVIAAGMLTALIGCDPKNNSDDSAIENAADATGEYIDDAAITTKVKTALFAEDDLSGYDIGVETEDGVVQLSGFVSFQREIERAVRVAGNVEGVRSVDNAISLQ